MTEQHDPHKISVTLINPDCDHQEKPQLLICRDKFGSASVSSKQANFD
jgi:hypothetical protein